MTAPVAKMADEVTLEQRLDMISQAQTDVDGARYRYDQAKEQANALKKEWEGRVETLGNIIRRMTQPPEALPLFEDAVEEHDENT